MQLPSLFRQLAGVRFGDRFVNDVPPNAETYLPLVEEGTECRGGHRGLQVRVMECDQGIIASQLQGNLLQPPASRFTDLAPGGRRARKGDHVYVRILGERRAHVAGTGQHGQDPFGHAGQLEQPGKQVAAAHRSLDIRLEHYRIAHGECRQNNPCRQNERRVPWRDDTDHAQRYSPGITPSGCRGGQDMTDRLPGVPRRLDGLTRGGKDFKRRLRCNGARFPDDPATDLLGMKLAQLREATQDIASLHRRPASPVVLGQACAATSIGDIIKAGDASLVKRHSTGLVGDDGASSRRRPETSDVHRTRHLIAQQTSTAIQILLRHAFPQSKFLTLKNMGKESARNCRKRQTAFERKENHLVGQEHFVETAQLVFSTGSPCTPHACEGETRVALAVQPQELDVPSGSGVQTHALNVTAARGASRMQVPKRQGHGTSMTINYIDGADLSRQLRIGPSQPAIQRQATSLDQNNVAAHRIRMNRAEQLSLPLDACHVPVRLEEAPQGQPRFHDELHCGMELLTGWQVVIHSCCVPSILMRLERFQQVISAA
ncbi:hypothetical protein D9M71_151400 [compost metagenome]